MRVRACPPSDAAGRLRANPRVGGRRAGLPWCFIASAALVLAACSQTGVLDPQGPVAAAELLLLINTTGIMLALSI